MDRTCTTKAAGASGETVAVVGAGISGLATAWLLQQRYRVTLFEADSRPGGHTNTLTVRDEGRDLPVDTGFIVYNERNYPLLTELFRWLDVATQPGDMSFGVSIRGRDSELEYAGDNLATLFAQRSNLWRPAHWQMLREILRFNRQTRMLLAKGGLRGLSLGEYLDRSGYSVHFRQRYLLPMGGAIWSCPVQAMLAFPAESFARFFENHGLLSINERPSWRTVVNGSQQYVNRLLNDFSGDVRTGFPVTRIRRCANGVEVVGRSGQVQVFDRVVLATHANQSLRMLADATPAERSVLSAFEYQQNIAWLHSDERQMPRRRAAWSSWNYLAEEGVGSGNIAVTYWMNRLQSLPARRNYFVTLNPLREPQHVHRRIEYSHPVFTATAMQAQRRIAGIQGERTMFAGAWQGYGFHEDGLRSAVQVAARLDVAPPWAGGVSNIATSQQAFETTSPRPQAARVALEQAG